MTAGLKRYYLDGSLHFITYLNGQKGLVEVDACPWKFAVRESHSFQTME